MTTDSVEPNSMHQAVWKSTVAIFEPTVRITRQPSDQTPSSTKKPPTACANRLDVRARDRQDHGASMAWGVARRFSTKED